MSSDDDTAISKMKNWVIRLCLLGALAGSSLLAGCRPVQEQPADLQVRVSALPAQDDLTDARPTEIAVVLPAGSTAQQALDEAGLKMGELDRLEPPPQTVLAQGALVKIVRVQEEFEVEESAVPFERQTVRSMDIPEGEKRLLQAGENGLEEVTRRRLFEDGRQVSLTQVKTVVIKPPVPEILMIGSQLPLTAIPIPGTLAYLSGGNAWIMSENTANRRPLLMNGQLDGRIFSLSPDGSWLLYTQRSESTGVINHLYAMSTAEGDAKAVDLQVDNIIHFAAWVPASGLRVTYSTVEAREAAPGWQANNDLQTVDFSANGWVSKAAQVLETNSGGIYGWWGTDFRWSPDGKRLAYVQPDEFGLVDLEENTLEPILKITPFQTMGDWAWVPGLAWSPDGVLLYTILHGGAGVEADFAESSQQFDLTAIEPGNAPVTMVPQTGMFASPVPSPFQKEGSGERAYQLAFLQAVFPNQSQTSRYHVMVIDRDGSNKRRLFPPEGLPGVEPQNLVWSPAALSKGGPAGFEGFALAVVYQGDLWLIEVGSANAHRISGEGILTRLDWR